MARENIGHLDPFASAPPGIGMTAEPQGHAWERPPRFSKPIDAANVIIDRMEKPNVKEQLLNLMAAGVTIESIVNTVALGGFTEGEFTPDTAELLKPGLTLYLVGAALENNIEATVFNKGSDDEDGKVKNKDLLNIMQDMRPDQYNAIQAGQGEVAMPEIPVDEEQVNVQQALAIELEPQNELEPREGFMNREVI